MAYNKLAGAIAGLTPQQNCLSLIATKVARLGVLLTPGKIPNNESLLDSIEDLTIYGMLLHMLHVEYQNKGRIPVGGQILSQP